MPPSVCEATLAWLSRDALVVAREAGLRPMVSALLGVCVAG